MGILLQPSRYQIKVFSLSKKKKKKKILNNIKIHFLLLYISFFQAKSIEFAQRKQCQIKFATSSTEILTYTHRLKVKVFGRNGALPNGQVISNWVSHTIII